MIYQILRALFITAIVSALEIIIIGAIVLVPYTPYVTLAFRLILASLGSYIAYGWFFMISECVEDFKDAMNKE